MVTAAAPRDSETADTTLTEESFRGCIHGYIGLFDQTYCTYVREYLCVTNNDKTCTRSIGATSDLPRGRKRPKDESAKITKCGILDIWPVDRCVKRFQVTYLALSDTYLLLESRI